MAGTDAQPRENTLASTVGDGETLPAISGVDLGVVIVSYNTRDMLRDCLLAIPQAVEGLTAQVWVVDNNSPDKSAQMVAEEFPEVHLITNSDNPGFARANNQAIQQAIQQARHIVLLNPDTQARPASLSLLARYLNTHPEAGAAGPKLLNSDGTLQPNGRRFPTVGRELLVTLGLNALRRKTFDRAEFQRPDFDQTCEVDQVSGACLMMRGQCVREIGPLDANFFMFYEETEWCWRLRRAGYKVVYVGDAQVVHHWMGSVRQLGRASAAHLRRSARRYYRKTGGAGAALAISGVLALSALRTEILYMGAAIKRRLRARNWIK